MNATPAYEDYGNIATIQDLTLGKILVSSNVALSADVERAVITQVKKDHPNGLDQHATGVVNDLRCSLFNRTYTRVSYVVTKLP